MKRIYIDKDQFALVDDEDYEKVSQKTWQLITKATKRGPLYYAVNQWRVRGKMCRLKLHAFIMPPPPGMEIDHIDRNGLNNCKDNLRIVTRQQNAQNRAAWSASGYKGVGRSTSKRNPYLAQMRIDGKVTYLGLAVS